MEEGKGGFSACMQVVAGFALWPVPQLLSVLCEAGIQEQSARAATDGCYSMQLSSFHVWVQHSQLASLLHKHEILLSILLSSGLWVAVLVWIQLTHLRWGIPWRGLLSSLCQPALHISHSLHDGQLSALLSLAKTKLRVCLPC